MRAMVLCAGFGTRLGDLTRETPKPMLLLEGRPMLEYIIRHLAGQGFDQVAINLHFVPEIVQNYFGDGSKWNVKITYSYEPELLGTAGGVKQMAEFLCQDDAFLIQYGDVLTDQDFQSMLKYHHQKQALATLLLHKRSSSNSMVCLDEESRITRFLERPMKEECQGVTSSWVNSGVAICSPAILNEIPADKPCDLPRDVYSRLAGNGNLYGFLLSGYRCAVDSPERLEQAREVVRNSLIKLGPLPNDSS